MLAILGNIFRAARRVLLLMVAIAFGVTLIQAPANADGAFRWQNAGNGMYMEVWLSSTNDLANVIVYPYNASSSNQVWWDFVQSNPAGFYALVNENSGKVLDRWDQQNSNERCWAMQYSWTAEPWQHWSYNWIWSSRYGRHYTLWSNFTGCNGDSYWDSLSAYWESVPPVWQIPRQDCTEGSVLDPVNCYWKRDGE